MPETADNLARDYQITREACDVFAAASQRNTPPARPPGFSTGEIFPVEVPGGRAGPVKVAEDEHPRPQTDLAALARLRPLQEGGVTTAGNASGINDGAVAMIVASRKAGEAAGAKPLARVVASGVAGVPPRIMGIGPVEASKKALARAGLSLSDIDVIEINEAFAAQVLACLRGLELPFDDTRVNMNGGAIAVGHPFGASGPRIALTAARQLERTGGRYALVTMCVGVGQGIAAVLDASEPVAKNEFRTNGRYAEPTRHKFAKPLSNRMPPGTVPSKAIRCSGSLRHHVNEPHARLEIARLNAPELRSSKAVTKAT